MKPTTGEVTKSACKAWHEYVPEEIHCGPRPRRVIAPKASVRTNEHHLVYQGPISDKSRHKGADAVSNDDPSRLGIPGSQPIQGSGTILASPVMYGCCKSPKRAYARASDAAVVVDQGRYALASQKFSEPVVVAKGDSSARVDHGYGVGQRVLRWGPQPRAKRVAIVGRE